MTSYLTFNDVSNGLSTSYLGGSVAAYPYVYSNPIELNNGSIVSATLYFSGTGAFGFKMTADGTNYETVTSGVPHTFTNVGSELKWFVSGTGSLTYIQIDYNSERRNI